MAGSAPGHHGRPGSARIFPLMARTALLTIGRMPKALELARGLAALGWRVVVADPMPWHVCRLSRDVAVSHTTRRPNEDPAGYLDDLLGIVRDEGVELVVPVSEEAMHVVRLEGRLPAGTALFAAPAGLVHELHDKWRFNRRAAALGLPVPATAPLGTPEAAAIAAASDVVVKPQLSCGGMGVTYHVRGAALPARDAPALVQARVDGQHLSTCSVARDGRVLGTAVYRGTVLSGTVAVCFERVDDRPRVERWVEAFVRGTGYTGLVSFDFIAPADGTPYAIECNPRATSGLHFLEPLDVARALTDPATPTVGRKRGTRFQHGYTTLIEFYRELFTGGRPGRVLRALLGARDVVWSARDPLPFLGMTNASWGIIRASIREGVGMGEIATRDIAWLAPVGGPGASASGVSPPATAPAAGGARSPAMP